MAEKRYLFTPGPTPVPPEVLAAMSQPVVHHRGPDFKPIYERCLARLRDVFRTETEVLLFTSSGTGALEAATANLCSPGDRIVVVSAGYFGERWAAIGEIYGCEVEHVRYEWGENPSADDLAGRLRELGGATAVFVTQSETSTGVVGDVRALAAAAKDSGALVCVDAISSLGAVPCETDEWGLDVVVSASQKALMTPPGLAMTSVSEGAWSARERSTSPRFYFDWGRTREAQRKFDAAFTPAVSIVVGLDVALGLLLERGLDAAFEHHVRLGRACREGVKAMGLDLFSPDDDSSAVVTAVRMPEGFDADVLLLDLRDRFGITFAPGQGPLKGRILRIGHIGYFDVFDITTALAGLELGLTEAGADVERGVAVTRALEVYERTPA
ncbi:MAG: pyridoxal-phosphate-dependent aminotransferase family protein [Gaiellaceae bacterium]